MLLLDPTVQHPIAFTDYGNFIHLNPQGLPVLTDTDDLLALSGSNHLQPDNYQPTQRQAQLFGTYYAIRNPRVKAATKHNVNYTGPQAHWNWRYFQAAKLYQANQATANLDIACQTYKQLQADQVTDISSHNYR